MRNTDFNTLQRDLREHVEVVRATGEPLVVDHNGERDFVVLSPDTFDQLMALAQANHERLEREGWDLVGAIQSAKAGEEGRPIREAFAELAKKHGLSLRRR
ncbi:MAG: type II toxin-antitoxin system prevent-host-death family antitoxin [Myxococcota bacterium]